MEAVKDCYLMSFGKIEVIEEGIVEATIDPDVAIDIKMVEECENILEKLSEHQLGILVNKQNPYTYESEARHMIATLKLFKAMAVLLSGRGAVPASMMLSIPVDITTPVDLFHDREKALAWLRDQISGR